MITKQEIYDLICGVLTDSENDEYATIQDEACDMHDLLVLIKDSWEDTITAQ